MGRTLAYKGGSPGAEFTGLAICVIFFVCGIVVGTFSARALDEAGTEALRLSMAGHIGQMIDGSHRVPGFLETIWATGRMHLLVLFLGFSLLGALCLPVVAGVRGFTLSFSIAAFIRAFGTSGWPVAMALFGAAALLTIPGFFLLASQAFAVSARLGGALLGAGKLQARTLYDRAYLLRAALAGFLLLAAVVLELFLTPILVVWTSSFL
ncbi:MAG: stage II sporulation protein M [Oscillospiraceae bacterium]|nr:stage II sporulation protein M [Oscillospiraceae bacterium]